MTEEMDFRPMDPAWELPRATVVELRRKAHRFCITTPVLNEGERIQRELRKIQALNVPADVILCDGGSTDGCTEARLLEELGVRTVLYKKSAGRMSSQLRLLYAYALTEGYAGVMNIDGNDKDGVEALPTFLEKLQEGYDCVLGSRFVPGGTHVNTPRSRELAIRWLHAPLISLGAGRRMTDTTNSYRAFSARLLSDPRVRPFRDVFDSYNLPYYLAVRAARLGFKTTEIPVSRSYPADGSVPTKITGVGRKLDILREVVETVIGRYNP